MFFLRICALFYNFAQNYAYEKDLHDNGRFDAGYDGVRPIGMGHGDEQE